MSLAGCGGSSGTASTTVGGSVSGVPSGTALLLTNNGGDIIMAGAGSNSFTFDSKVKVGSQYNVGLFVQPTGLYCTIANAQGVIDHYADPVTNVAVSCQSAPVAMTLYNVGVNVSGLTAGNSLTLLLYGSDALTINANGLAVFSQPLAKQQVLPPGPAVTVGKNPSGQNCTVGTNPITPATITNFVEMAVTCK